MVVVFDESRMIRIPDIPPDVSFVFREDFYQSGGAELPPPKTAILSLFLRRIWEKVGFILGDFNKAELSYSQSFQGILLSKRISPNA